MLPLWLVGGGWRGRMGELLLLLMRDRLIRVTLLVVSDIELRIFRCG